MRSRLFMQGLIACTAVLAVWMVAGRTTAQTAPQETQVPVYNEGGPNTIPGQYIIVFKPGTSREAVLAAQSIVKRLDGKVGYTYTAALTGFSAKLPPSALKALRAVPSVAFIEADQKVSGDVVQNGAPPGLERTSKRLLPLPTFYSYSSSETGTGVNVYVIDSGILFTHTDFGGRASFGVDELGGSGVDCNGHGTHVAGTIGGTTYGIAKNVNLIAVRVLDCTLSGSVSGVAAGIDWVTMHAVKPAVANMSLSPISTANPQVGTLDTAVKASVASGVTYVVSGGENTMTNIGGDACLFSPAYLSKTNDVITVGAADPTNDNRASSSNFGTCLRLFAPGVNILSDWYTSNTATQTLSGTSMATAHVSGVAAKRLSNPLHTTDTPAQVWAAIHNADDVSTTAGWGGIGSPGTGSPNELLHWGSLNDGFNDGDPHLTTVDGAHYDFQSAGEFVSLRDSDGTEIQTRQAPIATTFNPGADPHDGLATCVSLNTAVAARVGEHRVTYESNLNGVPDPTGLQLRVDADLTTLGANGVDLGSGGRIVRTRAPGGLEVDFPDESVLFVTPGWWASQSKWYLNVDVSHTRAADGVLGVIPPRSWLPALPDGASMGPMPGSLHERYIDLYRKFADAWRVTDKTSLFDYAEGTSTETFTMRDWPLEHPPCVIPGTKPVPPVSEGVAQEACRSIKGKNMHADCVFDVMVTGNTGFAKTHELSQRIQADSTRTTVTDDEDPTQVGEWVTFTAIVSPIASTSKGIPRGAVQFTLDGGKVGEPAKLDSKGRATWETSRLRAGIHEVAASYVPDEDSEYLASNSLAKSHTVRRCFCLSDKNNRD